MILGDQWCQPASTWCSSVQECLRASSISSSLQLGSQPRVTFALHETTNQPRSTSLRFYMSSRDQQWNHYSPGCAGCAALLIPACHPGLIGKVTAFFSFGHPGSQADPKKLSGIPSPKCTNLDQFPFQKVEY